MSVSMVFEGGLFKMTDTFPFLLSLGWRKPDLSLLAAPANGPARVSRSRLREVFLRQRRALNHGLANSDQGRAVLVGSWSVFSGAVATDLLASNDLPFKSLINLFSAFFERRTQKCPSVPGTNPRMAHLTSS